MKNNPFFTLLLFCSFVISQEGEIIPLSQKVGSSIDPEENIFYTIFPEIKGFVSGQFYEVDKNRYIVRIVFIEYSHERLSQKSYTLREFVALQNYVNRQKMITESERKYISGELTYLNTDKVIKSIPLNQLVVMKHRDNKKIRGTMRSYDGKHIEIQTPISIISVPIWELEQISYRPSIIERLPWKLRIFGVTALVGLLISEFWNIQTNPRIDIQWYYRFFGTTIGLFSARETYDTVNILLSPMKSFALTPSEMDLLKLKKQE